MPTFIDESGDTGPSDRGGKPYFRLAAVWVPTIEVAISLREGVKKLRLDLGLRRDYEFKFANTHSHPDRRRAFFVMALDREFRFSFSSIDKTDESWKSVGRHELYRVCATDIAVALKPIYHRAEEGRAGPLREPIVVDNNSDADFLEIIKQQFRGMRSRVRPDSSLIGKVTFRDSAPDEMLQLVDMVCGACGSLSSDHDRTWYDMIAERHMT